MFGTSLRSGGALAHARHHLFSGRSALNAKSFSIITKRPNHVRRQINGSLMITTRNIGFVKVLAKAGRLPVYIGGSVAAGGSYIAYKVEQASNFAQDKFSNVKDFTDGFLNLAGDFFKGLGSEGSTGGGADGGGGGSDGDTAAALGATAAAVGLSPDEESDDPPKDIYDDDEETLVDDEDNEAQNEEIENDMLNLTKQMIELKNILASMDYSETLRLPAIVVIGSQSSGKSSVLEAIVGQEFLPKGSNMVTRRPIELTLVNTPSAAAEVADFPALKMFNITDFKQVQNVLFDLNKAVPEYECISDDPIQITIRSPRVPDLSLVDLPGYIQVEAADQPMELKQKIRDLCKKYLDPPNIILAISAADVDLANSAALRASKIADPLGDRTIGVITKVDLVEPEKAKGILTNRKYPLKLGYVGVITKAPSAGKNSSLFSRRPINSHQAFVAQQNFESSYFKESRDSFTGTTTGTKNLKRKLIKVLEKSMATALRPTHLAIQQELEETSYQFKVEFNDRPLTPQMYLANNIDLLKLATKELSNNFSRRELRAILKNELDQRVLDLLAERYWNKPFKLNGETVIEPDLKELANLNNMDGDVYWHRKLDLSSNSLTKLGVGRLSTNLVTNALVMEIGNLVDNTQLRNHPMAKRAVQEAAKSVLSAKYYSTADQVENCIKPYKYEIEIEDREWQLSRENSICLLKEEMRQCEEVYNDLKKQVGGRKLNQVVTYLEKLHQQNTSEVDLNSNEALGFSSNLIKKGQDAIFLRDRLSLLKMRHQFLKSSKKCKKKENKYQCPEVYLDVVSSKLTSTAILFLNVELLSDFYYNFPRELDKKFFDTLSNEEIELFAKEDPKIKKHIELQERKDLLEAALNKIEGVVAIQRSKLNRLNEDEKKPKDSFFSWSR